MSTELAAYQMALLPKPRLTPYLNYCSPHPATYHPHAVFFCLCSNSKYFIFHDYFHSLLTRLYGSPALFTILMPLQEQRPARTGCSKNALLELQGWTALGRCHSDARSPSLGQSLPQVPASTPSFGNQVGI